MNSYCKHPFPSSPSFIIVITGGVLSGLGKGVVSALSARIMMDKRFKVGIVKLDGYLNYSRASLIGPYEHGEVFVLDDGTECDQDLGTYERFMGVRLSGKNNITAGMVFHNLYEKEIKGEFLGETIQLMTHATGELQIMILDALKGCEVGVIELGGNVGDVECMLLVETLRQMRCYEHNIPPTKFCFIHMGYVPINSLGEQKTKPLQNSIIKLRELGITPDIVIGRCDEKLNIKSIEKIAKYSGIRRDRILSDHNVDDIYEVPLYLYNKLLEIFIEMFSLDQREYLGWYNNIKKYIDVMTYKICSAKVCIVGKYSDLSDSYLSVIEACKHAAFKLDAKLKIDVVSSDSNPYDTMHYNGIIIPGGYGVRGIEGKLHTISYARETKTPILGLCLGAQLMFIDIAKNLLDIPDATSSEYSKNGTIILDYVKDVDSQEFMFKTQNLGLGQVFLSEGSYVHRIYNGKLVVKERHRHRFELIKSLIPEFNKIGKISGLSELGEARCFELPETEHPFFIGTQYHPEFISSIDTPHPIFVEFIRKSLSL